MKKFRIIYTKYFGCRKQYSITVYAQCEQDANNYLFEHYSGALLRTEFIK